MLDEETLPLGRLLGIFGREESTVTLLYATLHFLFLLVSIQYVAL